MDENIFCPNCHQSIKSIDFFCSVCGKNLRPIPLSTSFSTQFFLYLKTLLLPPFGLYWGYKYLRQTDSTSKLVGLVTIVITFIEIVLIIQSTFTVIDTVNQQLYQQSKLYGL